MSSTNNKKFRIQNGVDIVGEVVVGGQIVITEEGKLLLPAITDAVNEAVATDLAALQAQVDAILGTSPEHLDTLQEIVALFQSEDGDISTLITNNSTAITQIQQTLANGVATAAQGALADTAAQQADLDAVTAQITNGVATVDQGAKADTALQPSNFGSDFSSTNVTAIDPTSAATSGNALYQSNVPIEIANHDTYKITGTDGTYLVTYYPPSGNMKVYSATDGSYIKDITNMGGLQSVKLLKVTNGKILAAAVDQSNWQGMVVLFDIESGNVEWTKQGASANKYFGRNIAMNDTTVAIHHWPDGGSTRAGAVTIYDIAGNELYSYTGTANDERLGLGLAISNTHFAYVSGGSNYSGTPQLIVRSISDGSVVATVDHPTGNVSDSWGSESNDDNHVSMTDSYIAVGSAYESYTVDGVAKRGKVYIYDLSGSLVTTFSNIYGHNLASHSPDAFFGGTGIKLDGDLLFAGTYDIALGGSESVNTDQIMIYSISDNEHKATYEYSYTGSGNWGFGSHFDFENDVLFAGGGEPNGSIMNMWHFTSSTSTTFSVDDSLFATKSYVDSGVAGVDLSGYSTTTEMNTAISNVSVDLSGYSTTTEMNSAITAEVANVVDAAPAALDTLNELAAALGDDANFASTVTASIGTKADDATVTAALATKATAAQGALADTAIQPEDFGTGITTINTSVSDWSQDVVSDGMLMSIQPSNGDFFANDTHFAYQKSGSENYVEFNRVEVYPMSDPTNMQFSIDVDEGSAITMSSDKIAVLNPGNSASGGLKIHSLTDSSLLYSFVPADHHSYQADIEFYGEDKIVVGSGFDSPDYIHLYNIDGTLLNSLNREYIGGVMSISGDKLFCGHSGFNQNRGRVSVVDLTSFSAGSTDPIVQTIYSPEYTPNEYFGQVIVSNDRYLLVVRRDYNEVAGNSDQQNPGAVDVFNVSDGSYVSTFTNPNPTTQTRMGRPDSNAGDRENGVITIDGNYGFATAMDYNGSSGDLYVFDVTNGNLVKTIGHQSGIGKPGARNVLSGSTLINAKLGVARAIVPTTSSSSSFGVDQSVIATKAYVDSGVAGVDLSGYTDTSGMTAAIAVETSARTAAIAAIPATDLTPYSTTTEMNSAITAEVANVVDAAPAALDTLNELAAALGDDANFASTVTTSLAAKADDAATTAALATKVGLAEVDVRMEPIKQLAESAIQSEDFGAGISLSSQTLVDWSSDSVLQNPTTIDAPAGVTSDAWAYGTIIANNSTKWATNDALHDGEKGRVYVFNQSDNSLAFTLDGTSSSERMGAIGLIMNDEYIVAGSYRHNNEHGRVHVFSAVDGSPLYILEPDTIPNPWNQFNGRFGGKGLALEGSNLYVGTTEHIMIGDGNVDGQYQAGAVYYFDLSTGNKVSRIENPIAEGYTNNNWFGKEISVHGNNVYVSYGGTHGGLHHYTLSGSTLTLQNSFEFGGISGMGSGAHSQFGQQTDTNGTYFIAYAPMNQGNSGEFGVIVYKNEDLHNGVFEPVYNIDTTSYSGGLLFIDGNVIAAGVGSNDSIRIYTLGDTLSEVVIGQTLYDGNIYSNEAVSGGAKPFAYLSGSSKFFYRTEGSSADLGVYDVVSSTTSSYVVDDSVIATKAYVDSGVAGVDLSGYTDTSGMTAAIAAIPATDLTPYSTTAEMDSSIATAKSEAQSYADQVVAATVDAAPAALDTLNELAAALGDDANFASTVTASIATKADDAATTTALATKADQTDLDTLETFVKGSDIVTTTDISSNYFARVDNGQLTTQSGGRTKAYHEYLYKGSNLPAGSYSLDYNADPSGGGTSTVAIYSSNFNQWSSSYGGSYEQRYENSKSSQIARQDTPSGDNTFNFTVNEEFYILITTQGGGGLTYWNFANDALVRTETADSIATTASEIIPAINELHAEISALSGTDTSLTDSISANASAIAAETAARTAAIAAIPSTDLTPYSTTAEMNTAITAEVAATVDAAPAALDTLNELAAALGDDANFASTVTTSLASKADDAATTAALATKADTSAMTTALATKADASSLSSIEEFLNGTPSATTLSPLTNIENPPPSAYTQWSADDEGLFGHKISSSEDFVFVAAGAHNGGQGMLWVYPKSDMSNPVEIIYPNFGLLESYSTPYFGFFTAFSETTKILMVGTRDANKIGGSNGGNEGAIHWFDLTDLNNITLLHTYYGEAGESIGATAAYDSGKFFSSRTGDSYGMVSKVVVWDETNLSAAPTQILDPGTEATSNEYFGYRLHAGQGYLYIYDMFAYADGSSSSRLGRWYIYDSSTLAYTGVSFNGHTNSQAFGALIDGYFVHGSRSTNASTPGHLIRTIIGTDTVVTSVSIDTGAYDQPLFMDETHAWWGNFGEVSSGYSGSLSAFAWNGDFTTSDITLNTDYANGYIHKDGDVVYVTARNQSSASWNNYATKYAKISRYSMSAGFSLQSDLEALVSAETTARESAVTSAISTASADATSKADAAQAAAATDATTKANAAQSAAATDATSKANAAQAAAATDATSKVNAAQAAAGTDATSKADAAQAAAISTASADATSKADAAQAAAISTASADATSKSNAAQASAISTASADATTKADAAQAAAQSYADGVGSAAVASVIDAAPASLDTLNELAAALGDDANFASTVTASLATKADATSTTASIATAKSEAIAGGIDGAKSILIGGICIAYDPVTGTISIDETEVASTLHVASSGDAGSLGSQSPSHYRIDVYDVNGTIVN